MTAIEADAALNSVGSFLERFESLRLKYSKEPPKIS
jgi:hypothetical protein